MTHEVPAPLAAEWLTALNSSDCAWLVTDEQLRTVHVNQGFTRLLGYTLADLAHATPLQCLLGSAELCAHIHDQLRVNGHYSGELQVYHRDGSALWVMACINTVNRQPMLPNSTTAKVITLTDIGLSKRFDALQRQVLEDVVMEKPLPQLLTHLCRTLESMAPRVRACIMSVDDQGTMQPLAAPSIAPHIVEFMRGLRISADMGSCGAAAYLGHDVLAHSIANSPNWKPMAPAFVAAGLHSCWSSPVRNHAGSIIGTLALYFDAPTTPSELHHQLMRSSLPLCAVAMEHDARKQRIHQLAYFDALTGLPNRATFTERMTQLLQHGHAHSRAALFYLDLDRFKLWNDSLGHAAGDALLCEVAQRLSSICQSTDILGRLSSDEFVLFMPHCPPEQIENVAQHLLDIVAKPFNIQSVVTTPNASLGVSTYPEDGTDAETLLRHADQAMYAAKTQGSQHWERYRAEMGKSSQERADLERELRNTLTAGGLQLHYQPQVFSDALRTLYGVEALARWQHPEWGWIAPNRFIAIAEDSALIHPLTSWLIDAACKQLAAWRAQGVHIPHVAVNLSSKNFHDPHFAMHVQQVIEQHGLQPSDVMLEITESVMLDSSAATLQNIESLRIMGVRLSMDDFGTGYSSLSHLHRLPISELKLDKSFVHDVTTSRSASALTHSILNIASSLGINVVAEGVETLEQAHWLTQQGCQVLQGYLYAKPMPPEEILPWMQKHTTGTRN